MENKVAKYFQIEQDIIAAIKSGQLKPGDKVDSESVLKKKFIPEGIPFDGTQDD